MLDSPFCCPKCGSPYFGRDIAPDGTPLPTVRCHGDSSTGPRVCGWRGEWPAPGPKWEWVEKITPDLVGLLSYNAHTGSLDIVRKPPEGEADESIIVEPK